jgi:hypothetical protein
MPERLALELAPRRGSSMQAHREALHPRTAGGGSTPASRRVLDDLRIPGGIVASGIRRTESEIRGPADL